MDLITHAQNELDAIGMTIDSPDEMNREMRKHILRLVMEFSNEGHSGFSASYAVSILEKLLRYQPLAPLSGNDEEWVNVAEQSGKPLWQNKRASHVFREGDDYAYDIQGKVLHLNSNIRQNQ
jgi:hypothetical protein